MKREETFRSAKTQQLYTMFLQYANGEIDISAVNRVLSIAEDSVLLEKSTNGYSLLMAILDLQAGNNARNAETAERIIVNLLKLLIDDVRKRQSNEMLRLLLITPCHRGFTPLHQAIMSGGPKILFSYLGEIAWALHRNIVLPGDFEALLIGASTTGVTSLHSALNGGRSEIMELYLGEVIWALDNGHLSERAYSELLIKPAAEGITPLHSALRRGVTPNRQMYFSKVEEAVARRFISREDYKQLLTRPDAAGFTPLHRAICSGNYNEVCVFYEALLNELTSDELSEQLFVRINGQFLFCSKKGEAGQRINEFIEEERNRSLLESIEEDLFHSGEKRKRTPAPDFSSIHDRPSSQSSSRGETREREQTRNRFLEAPRAKVRKKRRKGTPRPHTFSPFPKAQALTFSRQRAFRKDKDKTRGRERQREGEPFRRDMGGHRY